MFKFINNKEKTSNTITFIICSPGYRLVVVFPVLDTFKYVTDRFAYFLFSICMGIRLTPILYFQLPRSEVLHQIFTIKIPPMFILYLINSHLEFKVIEKPKLNLFFQLIGDQSGSSIPSTFSQSSHRVPRSIFQGIAITGVYGFLTSVTTTNYWCFPLKNLKVDKESLMLQLCKKNYKSDNNNKIVRVSIGLFWISFWSFSYSWAYSNQIKLSLWRHI